MGAILDLLKDIPLSAVVKERLTQAEAKITTLERENTILKEENAVLKRDVQNLKILLNQPKIQKPGDECPYCRRQTGELQRMEPNPIFGPHGINDGYYNAPVAEKPMRNRLK